ncbi:efflux RND transporter periplasmic adaptor subunit [Namhaeicola litoreus]|uniref:Efflux RND transporter periplasmic adaptor subunit n=1 Tax=Namhaeicola litoreus TaxID=1052145 RepID=A0ABW3Y538_9FLAO
MKSTLYIFVLFLIFSSCKKGEMSSSEDKATPPSNTIVLSLDQFDNGKMDFVQIRKEMISHKIEVNGVIEVPPNNRAVISAIAGGYIKNLKPIVGSSVKKGELLLTIENIAFVELQQEFLETSERLEYLKMEYERQKSLFEEQINSEKHFLIAKSNYQSALATYNGLKKQLEMLNLDPSSTNIQSEAPIKSPIEGMVSQIFVEMGNYISPHQKILEIVNDDHQHVELQVFEKEALNLRIGQKVEFKIPSLSDDLYEGEVYLIGNTLDENRTIKVHVDIDESVKQKFVVGMFVKAYIFTQKEMFMVLPEECIVKDESQNVLLKLIEKNDEIHLEKLYLNEPLIQDGMIIISDTSNLDLQDQFLIRGNILMVGEE